MWLKNFFAFVLFLGLMLNICLKNNIWRSKGFFDELNIKIGQIVLNLEILLIIFANSL